MFNFRVPKVYLAAVVAVIVAMAVYAMAAANTVPASTAGEGSGAISGYTVTAVAYNLNATTPSNIDSVTFTLSAPATTVKASLVAGTFYNCTVVSGNNWSCNTTSPQATVSAATLLDIIAKNN
jgi:hypothetical protein